MIVYISCIYLLECFEEEEEEEEEEKKRGNDRERVRFYNARPLSQASVASPASSARRKSLVYDESSHGRGRGEKEAGLGTGWEIFCQFK